MLFFGCFCRICFIHSSTGQLFVAASCSFQFCTVVAQLPFRESLIILVGVSTCNLDSRKVVAGHVLRSGSSRTNAGSGLAGLHCHLCGGAGCHNCWSQPQSAHQQKLVEMRNGCGTCRLHLHMELLLPFASLQTGYGDVTIQNGCMLFMSLYVLTGTVLVAIILNHLLENLRL